MSRGQNALAVNVNQIAQIEKHTQRLLVPEESSTKRIVHLQMVIMHRRKQRVRGMDMGAGPRTGLNKINRGRIVSVNGEVWNGENHSIGPYGLPCTFTA